METLTNTEENVMRPMDWALIIFVTGLPLIGLIMLLIWAFGDEKNIHKKNYAKGSLLLLLIGFIVVMSFLFLFGGIALVSGAFN